MQSIQFIEWRFSCHTLYQTKTPKSARDPLSRPIITSQYRFCHFLKLDTDYTLPKSDMWKQSQHWRSSHYQVTHVLNRNSNIHGICGKSDFPCHKELLLKQMILSLCERILSFKRSSHYEKGRNWIESRLDPVVSFWCAYFFQRSGYAIAQYHIICRNEHIF